MATRSRSTFKKRQKELARMEKQRDKAARRMQRKLEKQSGVQSDENAGEELFAEGEGYEPEPADLREDSSDPR